MMLLFICCYWKLGKKPIIILGSHGRKSSGVVQQKYMGGKALVFKYGGYPTGHAQENWGSMW
jgi:hypothetical protein